MSHSERIGPVDFGGQRIKVKVTMGIIDKFRVHRDATVCVVVFNYSAF